MDTTNGPAAPALNGLTRVIREYSLFQAVLLVVDRLREAHPQLSEDDLYDQLEFQATRAWVSLAATSIAWSFSKNTG